MINQIYKLNMIPDKVPVMVRVSQYDQYSRTIIFDLYDGAIEFEIPTGSTITIRGTKPDKTGFEYPCTFSGNRVEFILEPQVSVISGLVPAELRITSNNEIVGSCNFIFNIEETPLDKDTIISDTELPLIEEASQAAVIAQGAAARAEAEADRAEQVLASAVKSVNGELPDTQGNVEIPIPDVSNKMDLVNSPTANDILLADALGQAIDSGKSMLDMLKYIKTLTASDNINDLKENGVYYIGDTLPAGIPSTQDWTNSVVLVMGDGTNCQQHFIKPNGLYLTNRYVYYVMRQFSNNAWGSFTNISIENVQNSGIISDLNITNFTANATYIGKTNLSTLNRPDNAGSAFAISVISNSTDLGKQIYISDVGIRVRKLSYGVWGAWADLIKYQIWSVSINSHPTLGALSGGLLSNYTSFSIPIPDGYKILGTPYVVVNGTAGIIAQYDYQPDPTSVSPKIYLYNTKTTAQTLETNTKVFIHTLFVPI